MFVVFVLVALLVLGVLVAAHWYLWRRMVRDVSARGTWYRRVGTALIFLLPFTTVVAAVSARSGMPFTVERIFAWPGYLWLAVLLYLLLALLVGEAVRPLLHRLLARRDASGNAPGDVCEEAGDDIGSVARTAPSAQGSPAGAVGTAVAAPAGRTATAVRDGGGDADTGGGGDSGPGGSGRLLAPDPSRRLFVARGVAVAAGITAAGIVGNGVHEALRPPRLKRITVPLAKLPRAAHGYRIAVVSDIHLGPILGRSHTQRIVDVINRANADMVAIVGDLVDGDVADLGPAAVPLAQLRSRDGSYFVTGNHEYFSGADQWVDHVRELGVEPLENARRELPHFDLAGVNDPAGEREGEGPDFDRALGDRDPSRAVVLLAHQPVQIHEAARRGVDLQFSGHTHGGQMWPANHLAELANPTLAGLERYGDTQLYVTRGAGAWGPPVRVGAESDITVVELASRQT